jgi:hypothetical protein
MFKGCGLLHEAEIYGKSNVMCVLQQLAKVVEGWKRRQMDVYLFWLLLYAHRHRSILGAAGHIILTPVNQLMEVYAEPPEQSCLFRWTEKIASLCFGPSGDRTPYLLMNTSRSSGDSIKARSSSDSIKVM